MPSNDHSLPEGQAVVTVETNSSVERRDWEGRVVNDLRHILSASDRLRRRFGEVNELSGNEFHALRCIATAEMGGYFLTAGDLRDRVGVSGAAVTYLVDRMALAGHVRREADPSDGRRVVLRCTTTGLAEVKRLRERLAAHAHRALAKVHDDDLAAAHRVFTALGIALGDYRRDLEQW